MSNKWDKINARFDQALEAWISGKRAEIIGETGPETIKGATLEVKAPVSYITPDVVVLSVEETAVIIRSTIQ